MRSLEKGTMFKLKENNKLVHEYLTAKLNGGYERIVYQRIITLSRAYKINNMLKLIERYFNKPFTELTEKDMIRFRDDLNNDKVMSEKRKILKKGNKRNPLDYGTKEDIVSDFKAFWIFLQEYYEKKGKILPDINRFFRVRRPSDYRELKVDYLSIEQVNKLKQGIRDPQFLSCIYLALMSCARPCEIINVKLGDNVYKEKGKWIVYLPRIKGVSYKKYQFVIDIYAEQIIPYLEECLKTKKKGDKIYDYTPAQLRMRVSRLTKKVLKREYSPKILRKTGRMIRHWSHWDTELINKLSGHRAGSDIIQNYINHEGLEVPQTLSDKSQSITNPNLYEDMNNLKSEQTANQEAIKSMQKQIQELEKYQKMYIETIKNKGMISKEDIKYINEIIKSARNIKKKK